MSHNQLNNAISMYSFLNRDPLAVLKALASTVEEVSVNENC